MHNFIVIFRVKREQKSIQNTVRNIIFTYGICIDRFVTEIFMKALFHVHKFEMTS